MGQFNVRPSDCGHEDYPCCGCGSVTVFTGQDAIDADQEDGDLMYADLDCQDIPDEVFEPDTGLTDETPLGEQLDGGCDEY